MWRFADMRKHCAVTGRARWRMILTIVFAWLTTLPLGAALAAATYSVLSLDL